jgi:hypothetical protein
MGFGVKRKDVFAAFRAKKINFAPLPDTPETKHLVEVASPNGEMWTEYIPPELKRREPQRLADLYNIPVEWLYNPLMIPGEENKKPPS